MKNSLPGDFIWGVSTSAPQIEGAADADGRGPSIWDAFSARPGAIKNGATAQTACNYYELYGSDIALMQNLGIQAHRFSVSWTRVLPDGVGRINHAGLDFYERVIERHLEAGIDPWICLYHWDLPQALQDRGGWAERDCIGWFTDYAEIVLKRLADKVEYIVPFNERGVFNVFGAGFGVHAPGLKSRQTTLASIHHTNLAHSQTAEMLRRNWPHLKVGIVENICDVHPSSQDRLDVEAREYADAFWNRAVLDPNLLGTYPAGLADEFAAISRPADMDLIADEVDFVGMNYYCPMTVKHSQESPLGFAITGPVDQQAECSDMGWVISPEAFFQTLLSFSADYGSLPIFITENGIGAKEPSAVSSILNDHRRGDYLRRHVDSLERALRAGVDLRGYFVWTLLDNFEWSAGYEFRFGLVHVDFNELVRTPKQSFFDYQSIINHHQKA